MYNIYDILEEIDFKIVNKELEFIKVYDSGRTVHINFYIKHKDEAIFDYSPRYYEIYRCSGISGDRYEIQMYKSFDGKGI